MSNKHKRRILGHRCRVCHQETRPYTTHCGQHTEPYPKHLYQPWELAQMKKPVPPADGRDARTPGKGDAFRDRDRVWEYLTCCEYDDGTKRELSTLYVFRDGSLIKLCLSDRHNGRITFSTGECFEEALQEMEDRLEADSCDWRIGKKKPNQR